MMEAIDSGIPYLIAEAPHFRCFDQIDTYEWSSYGYCGFTGNALWADTPEDVRWHPDVLPMREKGSQAAIVGQKPNDHSLRGADHVAWLRRKLEEHPNAEFRPSPLMVQGGLEPIMDFYNRIDKVIAHVSTLANEACLLGIPYEVEKGSIAFNVKDRRQWAHDISWRHFSHDTMATTRIGKHILSGYEQALHRARNGGQEIPREKIKGPHTCGYPEDVLEHWKTGERL
jgi:hypothetical protein